MIKEYSCGIIPLQKEENLWRVLMVKIHSGRHWGFPKGNMERGEEAFQTAERELREETGLQVRKFLYEKPFQERYRLIRKGEEREKEVLYFLAEVKGELCLQEEEIEESCWLPVKEVKKKISFPEAKVLWQNVLSVINILISKTDAGRS